jgi:hypothetical protein
MEVTADGLRMPILPKLQNRADVVHRHRGARRSRVHGVDLHVETDLAQVRLDDLVASGCGEARVGHDRPLRGLPPPTMSCSAAAKVEGVLYCVARVEADRARDQAA